MTMWYIKRFVFFLLLVINVSMLWAGNDPDFYWEPKLSSSYDISTRYTLQAGLKIRQDLKWGASGYSGIRKAEGQFFITRKTFTGNKLSLGYVYSGNDQFKPSVRIENRATLQYSFKSLLLGSKFSHRTRFENRLYPDDYVIRLRYRLSYSAPISGDRLDEGEMYWIASNEILWNLNNKSQDVEDRLSVGVGWLPSKDQKLQLALEYRGSDINTSKVGHAVFIATSFYFGI